MRLALRTPSEQVETQSAGFSAPNLAGSFITVIDDDQDIRRSTQLMLEQLGADVFCASSLASAVGPLGRMGRMPSLILCDYRLEEENGLEVIQALRHEFNEDIPAILITGDTSPDHVTEFRSAGVHVLHKPIPGNVLLAAIHKELALVTPTPL
jgi:CheY-like chemotaxis protein